MPNKLDLVQSRIYRSTETRAHAAGSATVTGCPLRWKTARGTCALQATILLLRMTRRTIMYRDHDTETSF